MVALTSKSAQTQKMLGQKSENQRSLESLDKYSAIAGANANPVTHSTEPLTVETVKPHLFTEPDKRRLMTLFMQSEDILYFTYGLLYPQAVIQMQQQMARVIMNQQLQQQQLQNGHVQTQVVHHHNAETNDYLNTGIVNQHKRNGLDSDNVSANNMAQGEYIVEETNSINNRQQLNN